MVQHIWLWLSCPSLNELSIEPCTEHARREALSTWSWSCRCESREIVQSSGLHRESISSCLLRLSCPIRSARFHSKVSILASSAAIERSSEVRTLSPRFRAAKASPVLGTLILLGPMDSKHWRYLHISLRALLWLARKSSLTWDHARRDITREAWNVSWIVRQSDTEAPPHDPRWSANGSAGGKTIAMSRHLWLTIWSWRFEISNPRPSNCLMHRVKVSEDIIHSTELFGHTGYLPVACALAQMSRQKATADHMAQVSVS